MSGSGRQDPPGCPGVVCRSSRMTSSGREALEDVRWVDGGPSGISGNGREPSQMSRIGPEDVSDVREW